MPRVSELAALAGRRAGAAERLACASDPQVRCGTARAVLSPPPRSPTSPLLPPSPPTRYRDAHVRPLEPNSGRLGLAPSHLGMAARCLQAAPGQSYFLATTRLRSGTCGRCPCCCRRSSASPFGPLLRRRRGRRVRAPGEADPARNATAGLRNASPAHWGQGSGHSCGSHTQRSAARTLRGN